MDDRNRNQNIYTRLKFFCKEFKSRNPLGDEVFHPQWACVANSSPDNYNQGCFSPYKQKYFHQAKLTIKKQYVPINNAQIFL